MSGGVDSAVSAALLMRAGFEVVGVTCRFHQDDASDHAVADASEVCARLGIAHVESDCTAQFESKVIAPFVDSYASGLTPSPCVGCNASCKIPALINAAKELNCNKVATGHYARIAQLSANDRFVVLTALDARKDQSYMLSLLEQDQLERMILPLGAMTKAEVRIIAADLGLPVAEKAESQDVCFIEGDYRSFLQARGIVDAPGTIVDKVGTVVGRHSGLARFTIGQRKGIGVAAPEPYYVIEKRVKTKELVVGFAHEALVKVVHIGRMNWQACATLTQPRDASVKLRYRSPAVPCIIVPKPDGGVRVELRSPQPTTAPGQYAVCYEGSTVLGGGMIEGVEQA